MAAALVLSAVVIVTVILDQLTKGLAFAYSATADGGALNARSLVRPTLNTRTMLSRLPNRPAALALWALCSLCIALALLATADFGHSHLIQIGLAAVLGGATGNVIDRLRRGGVVDFVALPFWPTFNLADVALVFGTALVLVGIL